MPSISHHMNSTNQLTVIIPIENIEYPRPNDQYSTYVLDSMFKIQLNFKSFLETYGNFKSIVTPLNQAFFLFINHIKISLLFIHFLKENLTELNNNWKKSCKHIMSNQTDLQH